MRYGTSQSLICYAVCKYADVTWTTTGTSSDELEYTNTGIVFSILSITNVKLDHMGDYTCIANDIGVITEATVTLTVYGKCSYLMMTPYLIFYPIVPAPVVTTPLTANHSHGDNTHVILTCTFQSLTTPNITWSTNATNQILSNPTLSSSSISHTSILMLRNITSDNEGLYTCTATNEGGRIQSSGRVDILGKTRLS